jgi:hypothetical protein
VEDAWDPVNPTAPRESYGAILSGLTGTRSTANTDLPSALHALIQLRTAKIGRSFRGRIHMPPLLSETDLTDKLFTTSGSYYTALAAFAAKLGSSFGGGSTWSSLWIDTWHAKVGVYSRTRRARGEDTWFEPVTSASVTREPHWLRSRTR